MPEADMKILLVEDNDIDALVIQRLLRRLKLDYSIVRAKNGEEALDILRSDVSGKTLVPPFTMIVDINMPRMTGFELLDEVINDTHLSQVTIYILSSSDNTHDKVRAEKYQIRGYVVKPITEPVLLDMLDEQESDEQDAA